MDVADLMTPNPIVVGEQTSIAECAHLLSTRRFRHLPMVDTKGRLSGVVTDFGVFRRGGLAGAHGEVWVPFEDAATELRAVDIAEPAHLTAQPEEALESLLARLAKAPQDLAVVVDEHHHPMGVITEHDGVRYAQGLGPMPLPAGRAGSRPIATVRADHPAQAAWALMLERQIRHVVVLDQTGALVGILSYRDLIEDDVASGRDLTCFEVVRHEETMTIDPEAPLHEAASLMAKHRFGCLPVMAAGAVAPEALLTRTDLIQAAVQSLQDEELFDDID